MNPLLINGHIRPVCPLAPKRRGVADRGFLYIMCQIYIGSLAAPRMIFRVTAEFTAPRILSTA